MGLLHLELVDFRCFPAVELTPDPEGTTVITGRNGSGKTTLLEALAYLGSGRSFRGAPKEAMVRNGASSAVIRADLDNVGRHLLVEAELALTGRSRVQINRQSQISRRDLAEAVAVTVFSPDDLALVQGAPARRRELLDDAMALLDSRSVPIVEEVERVLRQRAALLRQSSGRLTPEIETTLDVWDDRLVDAATSLVMSREQLARDLEPRVNASYGALARRAIHVESGEEANVELVYQRSWEGELREALVRARATDLRRGVTTVGPHRDDLEIRLATREARTQASQGEQRCLALALRLGVHGLVSELRAPPVLLLDDVFSELDPVRSRALIEEIPPGQALLTTAVPLPDGVEVASVVDVEQLGSSGGATRREAAP
jgi:DNA replication and repair protein RecF